MKRAVYERDGGRCRYADEQGRRCTARQGLEFHHRHPFAHGGHHSVANISLACGATTATWPRSTTAGKPWLGVAAREPVRWSRHPFPRPEDPPVGRVPRPGVPQSRSGDGGRVQWGLAFRGASALCRTGNPQACRGREARRLAGAQVGATASRGSGLERTPPRRTAWPRRDARGPAGAALRAPPGSPNASKPYSSCSTIRTNDPRFLASFGVGPPKREPSRRMYRLVP